MIKYECVEWRWMELKWKSRVGKERGWRDDSGRQAQKMEGGGAGEEDLARTWQRRVGV